MQQDDGRSGPPLDVVQSDPCGDRVAVLSGIATPLRAHLTAPISPSSLIDLVWTGSLWSYLASLKTAPVDERGMWKTTITLALALANRSRRSALGTRCGSPGNTFAA